MSTVIPAVIAGLLISAMLPVAWKSMEASLQSGNTGLNALPAAVRSAASTKWMVEGLYGLALFVAMVAGIVANYFFTNGVIGKLDPNQFWKPVLISPIIFITVYVAATNQPKGLIPILIAFQNGFFWQTVLTKMAPTPPAHP